MRLRVGRGRPARTEVVPCGIWPSRLPASSAERTGARRARRRPDPASAIRSTCAPDQAPSKPRCGRPSEISGWSSSTGKATGCMPRSPRGRCGGLDRCFAGRTAAPVSLSRLRKRRQPASRAGATGAAEPPAGDRRTWLMRRAVGAGPRRRPPKRSRQAPRSIDAVDMQRFRDSVAYLNSRSTPLAGIRAVHRSRTAWRRGGAGRRADAGELAAGRAAQLCQRAARPLVRGDRLLRAGQGPDRRRWRCRVIMEESRPPARPPTPMPLERAASAGLSAGLHPTVAHQDRTATDAQARPRHRA